MTDAEKELRRLAEELVTNEFRMDFLERGRMHAALSRRLGPKDVLALLERIEALERRVASLILQQADAIEAEEEKGTVYPRSSPALDEP